MLLRPAAAFLCLLVATGCPRREPAVPAGVTVVEDGLPPPPPAAVAEAQRRLEELDLYLGPVTGELTPAVRVALARFQRQQEIPVTGTLDPTTAAALGLEDPERLRGVPLEEEARDLPPRPSAAELLQRDEVPALPQPPPGALAGARAEAARLLAAASRTAGGEVAEAARRLPGGWVGAPEPGREVRAAEEAVPPDEEQENGPPPGEEAGLRGAERSADRAQTALAAARSEAFGRLLQARREGGWALLPDGLITELEQALERRALLLRGPDGRLGADDEAAIRWVQRSVGLEPSGLPTLEVLEVLGIDPGPMFEAP